MQKIKILLRGEKQMTKISRRTFLNISATSLALSLIPNTLKASQEKISWQGVALGAPSSMTLFHENSIYGEKIVSSCITEIKRLENIFSIYDKTSSISKLNKNGLLKNPPKELVEVLSFANKISKQSNGFFDVSIQPLWNIHKKYHNNKRVLNDKIKNTKELVNYKNILISKKEISFRKKNMSISLNAIAQGYITDKISELLRNKGFTNVLVDLGEIRAIGAHPDNRDWNIQTPYLKESYISINNQSMASSGGYGTMFNKELHHLFNPKSGTSENSIKAVSVVAKEAMLADALSTAIAVMPKKDRIKLLKFYPNVKVYIL